MHDSFQLPVLEYLDKHARGKWAFKLMISVTMKARWYKPRDLQDPDKPETYAPGKSCTGFTQDKFSRFTYVSRPLLSEVIILHGFKGQRNLKSMTSIVVHCIASLSKTFGNL